MNTPTSPEGFDIELLSATNVAQMISIQEVVCAQLESSDLFFPLSSEEMLEMVGPNALSLGAVAADGELMGFFGVIFMGDTPQNIGYDLGLSPSEIRSVAYFKSVNVLPQYRGFGLQKTLTQKLLEAIVARRGAPVSWACSTVAPQNISSLKSFIACGFSIQGLKPKYLGSWRYLMSRKLESQPIGEQLWDEERVPVSDYDRQIALLKMGWSGVQVQQEVCTCTNQNNVNQTYIKYTRRKE